MATLVGSSPPVGTGTAMGMLLSAIDMGGPSRDKHSRRARYLSYRHGRHHFGPTLPADTQVASPLTAGAIPVGLRNVESCEITCHRVCRPIRSLMTRATRLQLLMHSN